MNNSKALKFASKLLSLAVFFLENHICILIFIKYNNKTIKTSTLTLFSHLKGGKTGKMMSLKAHADGILKAYYAYAAYKGATAVACVAYV